MPRSKPDQAGPDAAARPVRSCAQCGGELRFSHREYAGRGGDRVVWRCARCGATDAISTARRDDQPAYRSRKPPVDEGPPSNPVIDPELARRLLGGG